MDAALSDLIERSRAFDGTPPFSDGALVELERGERQLIRLEDATALATDTTAEFVVDPDARRRGQGTRMLELLTSRSSGEKLFWAHGNHPAARALARSHGLEPVRELLQLRAPVGLGAAPPAAPPPAAPPAEFATSAPETGNEGAKQANSATGARTAPDDGAKPANSTTGARTAPDDGAKPANSATGFRVGRDEDPWLELNARAFAEHPEQGAVTRADLETLMAEPWFSPDDFLLLWQDEQLVGYCWLKAEGTLGEFYVVGVDPQRQGEGLGRMLVEAGMARLAERGIRESLLYVEADNAAALRLYRSFGFREHSIDVQYRWRPDTAGAPTFSR